MLRCETGAPGDDLSAVDYLDRDGLDCLLRAQREVIALSGSLELADERRAAVVRLLHLVDIDGASWVRLVDATAPPGEM
jgi:hypothetical protein